MSSDTTSPKGEILDVTAEVIPAVTTDNLLLVGPGYSLIIPPSAEKRKSALITTASAITAVATVEESAEASAEIKALAKIRNEIERGREQVKAPILQFGRDIDAKARDFAAELKQHEDRLSVLVKDYALKVEADRRAEQARLQEIERQRVAAEQKAERERMEEQRRNEEASRKAEEARLEAERLAAQADEDDIESQLAASRAIDEANAREKEAKAQAERDRLAEVDRESERLRREEETRRASSGARVVTKGVTFPLNFEVEDVAALHAFDPSLVTLTPKAREILAKVKAMEIEGKGAIPTIPGLRIFRDAKIQTR